MPAGNPSAWPRWKLLLRGRRSVSSAFAVVVASPESDPDRGTLQIEPLPQPVLEEAPIGRLNRIGLGENAEKLVFGDGHAESKETIINAISRVVPELKHMERGKNLDSRM